MTYKATTPPLTGAELDKILGKMEVIAQVVEGERLPNTANALRGLIAQARAQQESAAAERPDGAIHNAAAYANQLENIYDFECEAGPLRNCYEWIELRRCLNVLADYANAAPDAAHAGETCLVCDGKGHSTGSPRIGGRCMNCDGTGIEPTSAHAQQDAARAEDARAMAEFIVKHAVADHIDPNGPDCRSCACCDREIPINSSLYPADLKLEHADDCLFLKAQTLLAAAVAPSDAKGKADAANAGGAAMSDPVRRLAERLKWMLDVDQFRNVEAMLSAIEVPEWVYRSARDLAVSIWRDNYKASAPQWEPLNDLAGVISQIDNMVAGMRLVATAGEAHSDDLAVDRFAAAMKAKMSASRAKGRGGWEDPTQCPAERLQSMLIEHLVKGDPVDVANFAMMLWNRGERTATSAADAKDDVNSLRNQMAYIAAYDPDELTGGDTKEGLRAASRLRAIIVRARAAMAAAPVAKGEPGPWNVLGMEDMPDPDRKLDVVLTNGVTEYNRNHSQIDWTQVADWRYSQAQSSAKGGDV